jgi:outer membrane protein TolC
VIAILITSISASASPARADFKPTPTPTSTLSPVAQYEEALQQYKTELRAYQEARVLREQQLRMILNDFNRALRKASEDARLAGKSAASKAALAAARAAAATARDEAVALLGPEPEPPIAPMKPMKIAKSFAPSQKPGKKN